MEVVLNLAWTMLAALMFWLWLHHAARSGAGRRIQFVALVAMILILLPAISVTDDLVLAQNPAETDRSLRKSQLGTTGHSVHFPATASPTLFFVAPSFDKSQFTALGKVSPSTLKAPAAESIRNRPPPTA